MTAIFHHISESLQRSCAFSAPAARGTVRLALTEGGFRPRSVTHDEMAQVLVEILPIMLSDRGVRRPLTVCRGLLQDLEAI